MPNEETGETTADNTLPAVEVKPEEQKDPAKPEDKEPEKEKEEKKPTLNKEELKQRVQAASRLSEEDRVILFSLIDKA